jgi:hypothetical protein
MLFANTTVTKTTWTAILALAVSPALADGITTSISGYGTAGGTFTSDGNYAYIHNPTESTGASNSFDVGLDSRLGVQAVVSVDSQWSITAQEEVKLRGSTSFDPGTEWLYVQYQPISDLKLRVGRVVLPVFLVSDSIDVGYAVPWFRAPNDVYAQEPFDYLDGAQAIWRRSVGPLDLNLEITYGQSSATLNDAGFQLVLKSKSAFNAAIAVTWRNLLVRFAETDLDTTTSVPLSPTVTEEYKIDDRFHCIGLQYDDGRALAMIEWAKRSQTDLPGLNKPLVDATGWYAGLGWRFGKFTPMAIYSAYNLEESAISPVGDHDSWGASLRYDVVRNLDLKLQFNRPQADNGIYWVTSTASDKRVNVYSLGADFVF